MQPYPTVQNYSSFQPIAMPQYQDRLSQLQNNYQQAINATQPMQVNQGLLWVQGESGAKSYLVAPNTTVLLMDSESQRFYLKSTDNSGMPNLRTFEYSEVLQNTSQAPNSPEIDLDGKYVTREEYEGLKRQCESLVNRLESLSEKEIQAKPMKTKSKGASSDEQSDI